MELFKLFGTIALNGVDETHSALDGITNKASGIGSKIASGVGTVAKTVGKAAVGAVAATTTAVAAIGKTAVQSYAEYEQLVGGVDTLFKDSSKKVQNYADNAYKTAGLSANEYMDTVTSFSASLLQGLSGDTEAAAEMANTAITDMSDNANKMGTNMTLIQNAYQGFAKKNYTMLDNLKLGYGGTAAEMARLVNESGVLGEAITVTAETINDVSFDKIIEAIHVVQEEMGIAGTTAAEAATTISGSLSSVKASWSNLLTGMSSDDADIEQLIGNLTSSIETAAGNLLPRIAQTLSGIGTAAAQLAPVFADAISKLVTDVAPDLLQAGVDMADSLLTSFANSLIDTSPITAPIGQMILDVKESLSSAFSTLGENIDWDSVFSGLQGALEFTCGLVSDLAQEFEDFVTYATTEGTPLNNAILGIKESAQQVKDWFSENWSTVAADFGSVKTEIETAAGNIVTAFGNIITEVNKDDGVKTALDTFYKDIVSPLAESLGSIASIAGNVATGIGNIVTELIKAGKDEGGFLANAVEWFEVDLATAIEVVQESLEFVEELLNGNLTEAFSAVKTIGEEVADSWKTKFDEVKTSIDNIITSFQDFASKVSEQGLLGAITSTVVETGAKVGTAVGTWFNETFGGTTIKEAWDHARPDSEIGKGSGSSTIDKKSNDKTTQEFYASGAVLTEPTAFAMNPYTGKTMIGGESGAEAIAPIDTLQGYVSEAVEAKTSGMNDTLNRILDALVVMNDNMGANMRDAMEGVSLRMNNRELARAVKGVV